MKRSILKILTTILAIIIIVGILLTVYNSFEIDPRIWFFIIFGTAMILLFVVTDIIFYNELELLQNYMETHTYREFYKEYLKKHVYKLKRIFKKIKKFIKNFYDSKINKIINSICRLCVMLAIWYKVFFEEDFYSRILIYIIFWVMLCFVTLNDIIKAFNTRKKSDLIVAIMYAVIIYYEILNALAIYYL